MPRPIHGLIAAPFTPQHADGSLNLAAIEPYAEGLCRHGIGGAFVCGTTGEGMLLDLEERRQVLAAWVAARLPEFAVVAHVGHSCLASARELARHAEDCGADTIAATAAGFYKPAALDDLVEWCAAIAAEAPRTPFFYYHIPGMNGVTFLMHDFLRRAAPRIPTLAGVKFTHEDLLDFGRCIALEEGRFQMMFGRDEMLISGLVLGARGAVGGTYGLAPALYSRLFAAFREGDMAAALAEQRKAQSFIAILKRHGGLIAGKAAMKMIGLDCGPLRLPLRALDDRQAAALRAELEPVGFFEWGGWQGGSTLDI